MVALGAPSHRAHNGGARRPMPRDPARDSARDRARLIEIVKERSFQSGQEVRLASGKTSMFYFGIR